MDRRNWLLIQARGALALALPGAASRAAAQGETIRVVAGFAAGGSVDSLARMVAEHLQVALGRTAIVENRTGAGGRIAIDYVRAAAADGNTLLLAPQGPMTLFPHVFRNLRYDPAKDFVPVSGVAAGDFAFTIGPAVPATDMNGFRKWVATAGDKATYGSPGAGTLPHFVGVSIARAIGVPMAHVPYRGSTLSMIDLAGGAVASAVSPVTEALELHKVGRVRIIATTGSVRTPFVEGVPTLKELGIDVEVPLWFAVFAPGATPAASAEKLRAAIHAGLATASAKERLAKIGLVPFPSSGAELAALRQRGSAMWATVVPASDFTPSE